MKAGRFIQLLFLLPGVLLYQNAGAQNIRGDTIFVNETSTVEIVFNKRSEADLPKGDGSYQVKDGTNVSLLINASRKGVAEQPLNVTEGKRKHRFVLSYKESPPAKRINWSDLKKLKAHVEEKNRQAAAALGTANRLYDRAKNDLYNQPLWEQVEATYLKLESIVENKDESVVKLKLDEVRKQKKVIHNKKHSDAMAAGQSYFAAKRYAEAKEAYSKALEYKPDDALALKNLTFVDSFWAKEYELKGDEALRAKNYVLAKEQYAGGLKVKPGSPSLQHKFNLVIKDADPLIYRMERERGDRALRDNDIEEARSAYNAALSVRRDDRYIKNQIAKLIIEEEKIKVEEKKEAEYQRMLASAKSLAGAASNARGYDLAIKEYKRASDMFSARKFPKKRISELTRLKNGGAN